MSRRELGALPLPSGKRVGVRGHRDFNIDQGPLTRRASRADLSPSGRGGASCAAEHFHAAKCSSMLYCTEAARCGPAYSSNSLNVHTLPPAGTLAILGSPDRMA
jgi:hypothetical protein